MQCAIILLVSVVIAAPCAAATVSGRVADPAGQPVEEAVVTFVDEADTSQVFASRTGSDGRYRLILTTATAVGQQGSALPDAFGLSPNYPNPFNPSTFIPYRVGTAGPVRLAVYNLLGQPVRTLVDRALPAGPAIAAWDGRNNDGAGVAAGIYLVRLEAAGIALTRKMLLLDGIQNTARYSTRHSTRHSAQHSAQQEPPRLKHLQPGLQGPYTVTITGDDIAPFSRRGVTVRGDTTLDFEVERLPGAAIRVEAGGDINAALRQAAPGGLVLLSEGTYSGHNIVLQEGVILKGQGPARTFLVGGGLQAAQLSGAVLEDLTLTGAGDAAHPAIWLLEAEVTLRNCHIKDNPAFAAVLVEGPGAQALIEGCSITGNNGSGLWAKAGAQVRLSRSLLEDNAKGSTGGAALLLSDAGTLGIVRDNALQHNGGAALAVTSGAGGQIVANTFAGNGRQTTLAQIDIGGAGSDPALEANVLDGRGIRVRGGAAGRLIDNTVQADETGIALEVSGPQTNPVVEGNTFHGSVRIDAEARGQIVGNTVSEGQHGIEVNGAGTDPEIRANTLSGPGAGSVGIRLGPNADGRVRGNTIVGYDTAIQLIGTPGPGRDLGDNILSDNAQDLHRTGADVVWMDRFAGGMRDLMAGRFAKAAEVFRIAAAEAPFAAFDLQSRYYLGVTFMRMGRFGAAVPVLKEVLDLDPGHRSARWNLHHAYRLADPALAPLEARYRLDLAPGIPPSHPPVRFTDVAEQAGVALVNMGRGSAWRDLDGDGWLDLLSVRDGEPHALFRNRGDGTFTDIADQAGVADPRGGWSALWADYDNDDRPDIFVTRDGFAGVGTNTLFRNRGDGTFADVTEAAGLADDLADSFTSAWGDYDNDGWLDLYVGNGIRAKGYPNTLYRNQGDGTFADVSEAAGVDDGFRATIGVVWGDYDNDGWLDLYVVNNGGACALYRNQGDGTFTDVTEAAGVVGPLFGFVAFFIDYNNDGWLDLFVSSTSQTLGEVIDSAISGKPSLFSGNRAYLYRNNGDGTFTDVAPAAGLDRTLGTMAATYGDIDNDGYIDLYLANGGPAMDRFEPDLLYQNNGDGTFADVSLAAGVDIIDKGHGTTMADYDNDGDLDIYSPQGGVGGNAGQAQRNRLLRNEGNANHWLSVRLVGRGGADASALPASNRDGIGAQVTVWVGGTVRRAEVNGGSGFGVTNSLPLEFGLGAAVKADTVRVRWPSGHIDRLTDVAADRVLVVTEGDAPQP